MTSEQQRIAIAKACGWRRIHGAEIYEWSWMDKNDNGTNELPDYLNDLNAMHEAEKKLPEERHPKWIRYLVQICTQTAAERRDKLVAPPAYYTATATAAQRAEAFLRTLNLWKA